MSPPSMDTVLAELLGFLVEFCGIAAEADTPLAEAGLDSIQVAAVLEFAHQRFGADVPAGDVTRDAMATPRRMAALVARFAP